MVRRSCPIGPRPAFAEIGRTSGSPNPASPHSLSFGCRFRAWRVAVRGGCGRQDPRVGTPGANRKSDSHGGRAATSQSVRRWSRLLMLCPCHALLFGKAGVDFLLVAQAECEGAMHLLGSARAATRGAGGICNSNPSRGARPGRALLLESQSGIAFRKCFRSTYLRGSDSDRPDFRCGSQLYSKYEDGDLDTGRSVCRRGTVGAAQREVAEPVVQRCR